MAINPITFDGEHVAARDHGALFRGILSDGKINGCNVIFNGASVTIGKGYLVSCGRLIEIDSNTSIEVSGTGYSQVILNIDLSEDLPYLSAVTSASQSFPALTQEDINDGVHQTYQMQVAVINLSNNSVIKQMDNAAPIVADGSISSAKIAANSITSAKIAPGAVGSSQLGSGIPYSKVGLVANQVLHIVVSDTQPTGDWDIWMKPEA